MSLLYCDGMSKYNRTTGSTTREDMQASMWPNMSTSLVDVAHPLSGYAYYNSGSTNSFIVSFEAASATMIVGARVFFPASQAATIDLFEFNGEYAGTSARSYTRLHTVNLNFSGDFVINRDTFDEIGRTTGVGIRGDRWYYIEYKVVLATGATGSWEVKVDGVTVGSGSGVATSNVNTTSCIQTLLGVGATNDNRVADYYVCDGAGASLNDFLGDVHIETVFPDGDGNRNNWTPLSGLTNYEMVDETEPDRDTSYVSTSTAGNDELYTFAALTVDADTVLACVPKALMVSEDGGYREARVLCRSSVSESTGATYAISSGNRYRHLWGVIEQNPNGPAAWTDTTVNAAEFGVELVT